MDKKQTQEIKKQLFKKLLNSTTGDYAVMAKVASEIHPEGWR